MSIRVAGTMANKTVSLRDLLGKDIKEGKIVDIQQTSGGTVAIVQRTSEVPISKILAEL